MKDVASKETVVLHRWGIETRKFGIRGVGKACVWSTHTLSERWGELSKRQLHIFSRWYFLLLSARLTPNFRDLTRRVM